MANPARSTTAWPAILVATVLFVVLAAILTVGYRAFNETQGDDALDIDSEPDKDGHATAELSSASVSAKNPAAEAGGPADEESLGQESIQSSPFESDDHFWWMWASPSSIRTVWRDADGAPLGQLEFGRRALELDGERVIAITNGGIHQPGLVPSGLYIEDGRQLVEVNRAGGSGNFYLQPNGVFLIADGRAAVETTDMFLGRSADKTAAVDWAIQSGPMLVVDGEVNPLFTEESQSRHIRNAVAVDGNGRVLLIRSSGLVTMRQMAEKCVNLGAENVLYLDGTLSRLDRVEPGRMVPLNLPVASMIAVVEQQ